MSTENLTDNEQAVVELDCTDLLCPLPVYKAGIALSKLEIGQRLRLITTDPGALADIPAMTRQRGDTIVSIEEGPGHQVFVIEKGQGR